MSHVLQFAIALSFALPSLAMSRRLFHVWRAPMEVEDGRWVQLGVGVFVAEFILLHAGTFLGVNAAGVEDHGVGAFAILIGFYGLFILAISAAFKSTMFLQSFLTLVAGRGIAVFVGVSQRDGDLLLAHSIVGMVLYFVLVIASVFAPIPKRGITSEIAERFRMPGSSGVWVDEPHRAIGAAAIYFALLGVAELALLSWIDPAAIVDR